MYYHKWEIHYWWKMFPLSSSYVIPFQACSKCVLCTLLVWQHFQSLSDVSAKRQHGQMIKNFSFWCPLFYKISSHCKMLPLSSLCYIPFSLPLNCFLCKFFVIQHFWWTKMFSLCVFCFMSFSASWKCFLCLTCVMKHSYLQEM